MEIFTENNEITSNNKNIEQMELEVENEDYLSPPTHEDYHKFHFLKPLRRIWAKRMKFLQQRQENLISNQIEVANLETTSLNNEQEYMNNEIQLDNQPIDEISQNIDSNEPMITETNTNQIILNIIPSKNLFQKKNLVRVAARTGPGMNKLGGIGRIVNVAYDNEGMFKNFKFTIIILKRIIIIIRGTICVRCSILC